MNICQKSLKLTVIIATSVVGIVLLSLYFDVLPSLEKELSDKTGIEKLKKQSFSIMIGYFIFAFILNLAVWRMESKIKQEKKEIQSLLRISPGDQRLQEKLRALENKQQWPFVFVLALVIIGGLVISLMVATILVPLYKAVLDFKR